MATYIELVNKLLRKVNEVETDLVNFNSAIGVTAAAKDAIVDALDAIYNVKHKWPWMRSQTAVLLPHSFSLSNYIIAPTDMMSIDWNSFIVQPFSSKNYKGTWLQPMNQDEYWQYGYLDDLTKRNNVALGQPVSFDTPRYVVTGVMFEQAGQKAIYVTPPNLTDYDLTITYAYYKKPVRPVAATDIIDLPDEWQYVLMAKALYYMYLFYDNNERAAACEAEFQSGLKDMVTMLLTDQTQYVYSGMLGQVNPNTYGSKYLR